MFDKIRRTNYTLAVKDKHTDGQSDSMTDPAKRVKSGKTSYLYSPPLSKFRLFQFLLGKGLIFS